MAGKNVFSAFHQDVLVAKAQSQLKEYPQILHNLVQKHFVANQQRSTVILNQAEPDAKQSGPNIPGQVDAATIRERVNHLNSILDSDANLDATNAMKASEVVPIIQPNTCRTIAEGPNRIHTTTVPFKGLSFSEILFDLSHLPPDALKLTRMAPELFGRQGTDNMSQSLLGRRYKELGKSNAYYSSLVDHRTGAVTPYYNIDAESLSTNVGSFFEITSDIIHHGKIATRANISQTITRTLKGTIDGFWVPWLMQQPYVY